MPSLSLWIGLRYLRAKRRHRFISFISLVALLGIALGVTVLVVVLSVMNGFDSEIQNRVFGMADHITVLPDEGLQDWQALRQRLLKEPGVLAAAPVVNGQGMLSANGQVTSAWITGIDPALQATVSILHDRMQQGSLSALRAQQFGVVLGVQLARSLGLQLGDEVTVVVPRATVSLIGINPVFKRLHVVGLFEIGNGFGFDTHYAYVHWQDAQRLFGLGHKVSGVRLKVENLYQAPQIARKIMNDFDRKLRVRNWTQQFGALFKAIAMEKNMLFLILLLIIAVAVFNLVSALVMLVIDKQSDIAVLRTLGASRGMVMRVFMIQGSLVGVLGTVLGLIAGVSLALNVTPVVLWLQQILHLQLISSSVYYLDYLPTDIQVRDIVSITMLALLMSFIATLYPAWRAAKVQPAQVLRYE